MTLSEICDYIIIALTRNHPSDCVSNCAAKILLTEDWQSISNRDSCYSGYWVKIVTSNNKTVEFWNANRFYGWFSKGTIRYNDMTIKWDNEMPDTKYLVKLHRKLKGWLENEIKTRFCN